VNNKFKK